jgi:DNA-binding PadR family transcriptional regulator
VCGSYPQRAGRIAGDVVHGLRAALEVSDGNLSVHARKLEDAGYVACTKGFEGRTPRTEFKLTPAGRRAFEKYLDHMDALISASRRSQK